MSRIAIFPDQGLGHLEQHSNWEPLGGSGVYRRRLTLWRNFTNPRRHCQLLLFLDGQNTFQIGHQGSNPSWSAEHHLIKYPRPLLAVAIPASHRRYPEYVGWSREHYSPSAAKHARLLASFIVPYILSLYPRAQLQGLIGASAGGVAALYAGWTHPCLYPGIACLSAGRHYFRELLETFTGVPAPKVYLSCGNKGMDLDFQSANQEFAQALRRRGADLRLRMHQGDHSEPVWNRRLPDILKTFLT